jgi:hypothetical protein
MIIDPIEQVKAALPELKNISNYGNTLYLSVQQWNNRMKSIETKNLNKYRHSTCWVSLFMYFHSCVLCHHGENVIEINNEKYKLIRKYVMSEEFNIAKSKN